MQHATTTGSRWARRWLSSVAVLVATLFIGALVSAQAQPPAPPAGAPPAPQTPPAASSAAPDADTDATPAPPTRLPSAAEDARGTPIVAIDVAGNRRITSSDVVSILKERIGDPFSPEVLSDDVRELFQQGYFDNIDVDLTQRSEGIALRFLVHERPTVAVIEFNGNKEINNDDLNEAIELKTGEVLSPSVVQRSVQAIRDKYAEQGYYLVEATSEIVQQKNNVVTVKFTITEHSKVSVRRVTFIGNEHVSDAELQESMLTGHQAFLNLGGSSFRADYFDQDRRVIQALYYDRGYLSVQMSEPRVMLTPDKNGIEVTITIDEGPRYRIRQLRVYEEGADGREIEPIGGRRNLRMMVRGKPGDWFNRAALYEDLQSIALLYKDHGYAFVDTTPKTELDPDHHEVDIIVPVKRGPLVHFERIEVQGNSKTRDKVIRRELEVHEGDLYSETKLVESKRRVTALGYFERVDYTTPAGSAPDRLNVSFSVGEKPTGTFQLGAGFSSIENFIATAQIQQANLFGNGQSLSLQGQVSGLKQELSLRLYEPYFLDSKFSTSVELHSTLSVYNDFSVSSKGGSLTFGYPLIEPDLVASLTYTGELNRVSTQPQSTFFGTSSGVSVFRQLPLANLFNDGFQSSIRPALTYDTRDNRLFPTSGLYLSLSSELAASWLGSEQEYLRHRFSGRYFYPIGAGFVLKFNQEAGLVTSPNRDGVPIFARFFLGGILDVRGFEYRSIGPRMPLTKITDPNSAPIFNGAVIGGNVEYYQNLELEFPIVDAVGVRGVVFTDAGNAWNLEQNYCDTGGASIPYRVASPCFDGFSSLSALRTSWGFGIRWFSPLGPLRFEWGFPFAPLPYEPSSKFEFTIGNFF